VGDIVSISHLRWDFVWQRPQHLLSRLARQGRVLFVEEPVAAALDTNPYLEISPAQNAPGVTIARLHYPVSESRWIGHGDPLTQTTYTCLLNEYLQSVGYGAGDGPLLWLYTPMALDFADNIKHKQLVYDVMDQLAAFKGAPPELLAMEENLLRRADTVFTGGVSLYRAKLPYNFHTYLFPSGVEVEHFAQAAHRQAFSLPPELAELTGPILGYYGVIDERMDLRLLAHLAAAHPEWNIVLLGPILKIDAADLPTAPNLSYPGMKTYDQLPAYLAYFDVALIPFAMNEATRFLSPTKTLEYMAAHKPIVSNPIPDVVELYDEVVRIAHSPTEFVAQVEAALQAADNSQRRPREDQLLAQYTWDNIATQMEKIVSRSQLAVVS